MEKTSADIMGLCKVIDYHFQDIRLLEQALNHASLLVKRKVKTNERFEFLGDRVLGLVVSEMLMQAFPDDPEGLLAKRLSFLVRREAVAVVANQINLGQILKISRSEELANGRQNPKVLADSCEALIAAIYLDGGFDQARKFIHKYWAGMVPNACVKKIVDPKTALQEWSQSRGLGLPVYQEMAVEGASHAPYFTIQVSVGSQHHAMGQGRAKKHAEQAAAETLLNKLQQG